MMIMMMAVMTSRYIYLYTYTAYIVCENICVNAIARISQREYLDGDDAHNARTYMYICIHMCARISRREYLATAMRLLFFPPSTLYPLLRCSPQATIGRPKQALRPSNAFSVAPKQRFPCKATASAQLLSPGCSRTSPTSGRHLLLDDLASSIELLQLRGLRSPLSLHLLP